jgi:hypothetical protein
MSEFCRVEHYYEQIVMEPDRPEALCWTKMERIDEDGYWKNDWTPGNCSLLLSCIGSAAVHCTEAKCGSGTAGFPGDCTGPFIE